MSCRKRKPLTLEERIKVLKRHGNGEKAITIARSLGVGKTQIQSIIKDKEDILKRWQAGENTDRKQCKRKKSAYCEINEKVWEWFIEARKQNILVNGPQIQEKARTLSIEFGQNDFAASNGWLYKWLKRNNIKTASLSGERGYVPPEIVGDWVKGIPDLCEGYDPENIFSAVETGLYFRALPDKYMISEGEDSTAVEVSKEHITVLLAASFTGEKIKPLIIGKSAKPRSFLSHDISSLGVDYFNNKKAWMTIQIFTQWANKLNNKMKTLERKVLIFMDDCSAHPTLTLSNIKFVMLPTNNTSKLQPLEAGVIQAVKLHYRKQLLRHLLFEIEQGGTTTGPEFAKSVSLLDAALWIKKAWSFIQPDTIKKCFRNRGFLCDPPGLDEPVSDSSFQLEESEGSDDNVEEWLLDRMSLEEFATFDNDIQVTADYATSSNSQCEKDKACTTDIKEEEAEPIINFKEAVECARKLSKFALKYMPSLSDTPIHSAESEIQTHFLTRKAELKQQSFTDFIKKV